MALLILDLHSKKRGNYLSDCFEKEPNEKGRKTGFSCAQKVLKSQCIKGKGKDKQKERGRTERRPRREKTKSIVGLYCLTEGVYLGLRFFKIRLVMKT